MEKNIDSAFSEDGSRIDLDNKGIKDADFVYLLSKETKKVETLNLCTY